MGIFGQNVCIVDYTGIREYGSRAAMWGYSRLGSQRFTTRGITGKQDFMNRSTEAGSQARLLTSRINQGSGTKVSRGEDWTDKES